MAENKANKILTGSEAKVMINNEILGNAKKATAEVEGKFEAVDFIGDYTEYERYLGMSGKGTIELAKTRSMGLSLMGDAFKTGQFPDITIIATMTDKSTGKTERVALNGVVFKKLTLFDIEAKKMMDEKLEFSFSSFDPLETI